jgi:hypothetical protein
LWLLRGDFAQGWSEYEWRWLQPNTPPRSLPQPLWDGSPLDGKIILLHAEQGLGDTLHFIRYAPLVQQRGGKVIVECQSALRPLLTGFPGVSSLVDRGATLPAFEVQAPLLSLPRILNTRLNAIPNEVPYLHADSKLVSRWRRELRKDEGGRMTDDVGGYASSSFRLHPSSFRIGIAWQGSPTYRYDRQRSIPLSQFAPLSQIAGVRLISLQKGPGAEQLQMMKEEEGQGNEKSTMDTVSSFVLDETVGAFVDTGAIMEQLDLVICSDSAVAHLAGALGVPVWLALPLVPDWRWLLDREDSPWYPSMRLFRQTRCDQWDDVFERVTAELKTLLRN